MSLSERVADPIPLDASTRADHGPAVRRAFVDAAGTRWDVWCCVPSTSSKALTDAFAAGWLTFESPTGEKRRVAPAPPDWRTMPDDALARLLATARPARASGERGRER